MNKQRLGQQTASIFYQLDPSLQPPDTQGAKTAAGEPYSLGNFS